MTEKGTQHSEGMYRGGPKSRKRRIQILLIIYIAAVVVINLLSGSLGIFHAIFGLILAILIREDIKELRAQDVNIGIIRFFFYLITIIIPVFTIIYLLYRKIKV